MNTSSDPYHTRHLGEANAGGLREFRESPRHYRHWCQSTDSPDTEALRFGSAIDLALTEPEKFRERYVSIPVGNLGSNDGKVQYVEEIEAIAGAPWYLPPGKHKADELRAMARAHLESCGRIGIEPSELDQLRAMIASLNEPEHELARYALTGGERQKVIRWVDPETGISCKAKLDIWHESTGDLMDLKSGTDASLRGVRKACWQWDLAYQLAWYRRALRHEGHTVNRCSLITGEKASPYPWSVVEIDSADLDWCDEKHSESLRGIRDCLEANRWPSHNPDREALLLKLGYGRNER